MKSKKFRLIAASVLLLVGTAFGANAMFARIDCYYKINGGACTPAGGGAPITCHTTGTLPCVAGTNVVYYQESDCTNQTTNQNLHP